jgi:NAD(P)-dependent dehydrogenase (short-subunit alcohol dehydrogenase family)
MSEKFAVVSGSSSGLGLEISRILLELGFTVFGGSRSGTDLDHENFYDVELDVTSEESVADFFETISEFTKGVDIIVNNAGICFMNSISETSIEEFEDHLATNTLGPYLLFKFSEKFLIREQTHIISVLSTAAHFGYPNVSAYSASKFGQLGFLESLKKEWKDYKIKFTNLFPGAIDTPLWDKMGAHFSREKMLKIEDFGSVFQFVVEAPYAIQFPEVTFLHRDGFLE